MRSEANPQVSLQAVPGLGTLPLPCQLLDSVGSYYRSLSTLNRKEAVTHASQAAQSAKLLKDLLSAGPKAAENGSSRFDPSQALEQVSLL